MLAIQMASDSYLALMQSLQNIACVNGRPAVWERRVVRTLPPVMPVCKDIVEAVTARQATSRWRPAPPPAFSASTSCASFSVEDAKKAGLWGKQGPWQQYPKRMLQMRARGFAVRDAFPDVLRGLITAEESRVDRRPRHLPSGTTLDAEVDRKLPTARRWRRRSTEQPKRLRLMAQRLALPRWNCV